MGMLSLTCHERIHSVGCAGDVAFPAKDVNSWALLAHELMPVRLIPTIHRPYYYLLLYL